MSKGDCEAPAIKTRKAKAGAAARSQMKTLLEDPVAAADTTGHIPYLGQFRTVAEAMEDDGDDKGAANLISKALDVMKKRNILSSVLEKTERRLKRRS
jgi:hypothetical protein